MEKFGQPDMTEQELSEGETVRIPRPEMPNMTEDELDKGDTVHFKKPER